MREIFTAVGVILLVGVGVPVACSYMNTATTVATAPGRVVNRTLQTDNILQNYELFYDLNGQFKARTEQILSQRVIMLAESDPDEKRRLRMELSAMEQSCRDIAAQYNANSQKQNRSLFKANNLPETLTCE